MSRLEHKIVHGPTGTRAVQQPIRQRLPTTALNLCHEISIIAPVRTQQLR
jgi:hypothetical protein